MVFDVIVEEGRNEVGKQQIQVYRVHDSELSRYVRYQQENKKYIIGIIPLFVKRIDFGIVDQMVESDSISDIPEFDGL